MLKAGYRSPTPSATRVCSPGTITPKRAQWKSDMTRATDGLSLSQRADASSGGYIAAKKGCPKAGAVRGTHSASVVVVPSRKLGKWGLRPEGCARAPL